MKQFALGLFKAILKPLMLGDVAHDLGSANDGPARSSAQLEIVTILRAPLLHLVGFAEDSSEREIKDLLTTIVGDMQDPTAPILEVGRHDKRSNDAMRVLARLDQVLYISSAPVNQHTAIMGIVEIDVCHVRLPQKQ